VALREQPGAEFGHSVSTAGDVNGDGYGDVIVGADMWDGVAGPDVGAAFVFLGSPTGLGTAPAWTFEGGQAGAHYLGESVSTAGDVNADGYSDVIVSAAFPELLDPLVDVAFAFHGSAAGLASTPAWSFQNEQRDIDRWFWVSTAGDVDGDGYSDVLIGVPWWDGATGKSGGQVLAFHGSASGLGAAPAWRYESSQARAALGFSVATAGDVDGDGYSDVLVGAPWWDGEAGDYAGAAFLFHGSPSGLASVPAWSQEGSQAEAFFGWVSTAGDVDGDGYSDVVVGTVCWVSTDEGMAEVFNGNAGSGLDRIPRQARASGAAPIDLLGKTPDGTGFLLRANGRSPFGRDRVRLEWEVEPLGTPFDGLGIQVSNWFDTGVPGAAGSVVALEELQPPLPGPGPYRWRLRLRAATSGFGLPGGAAVTPYPWQSHWLTLPYNNVTETDLRVVGAALPCALNAVDLETAPVTPPRVTPWVYDLDCGSGTPDRLNPARGRVASAAPVPGVTAFDTASPGSPGTLTLVQLACGCAADIRLVKSRIADELVLY